MILVIAFRHVYVHTLDSSETSVAVLPDWILSELRKRHVLSESSFPDWDRVSEHAAAEYVRSEGLGRP